MTALRPTDLTALDTEKVLATEEELIARLSAINSRINFRVGVNRDVLVRYFAILLAAARDEADRLLASRSLYAINQDPTLADDSLVDEAIALYFASRSEGQKSAGSVLVTLSTNAEIIVASNAVFRAGDLVFVTPRSFSAQRNEADVIGAGDRLLHPLSGGLYGVVIDLVAEQPGSAYQLRRGTSLVPDVVPTGFVSARVIADFSTGKAEETNEEIVRRLRDGITVQAMSGRGAMKSLLRSRFPSIIDSSVIGMGDSEMTRDQLTLFPISVGSRCDWYVRSATRPARVESVKTATLISKDGSVGTWRMNFASTESPGFYDVVSILQEDSPVETEGSYNILSTTTGINPGTGWAPDIDVVTGAFSKYQTLSVTFEDTDTDVTDITTGTTRSYKVVTRGFPLLDEMQDSMSALTTRNFGADVLIRAPIPCFVKFSMVIEKPVTQSTPNLTAIRTALADFVNSEGFAGQITISSLLNIAHDYLEAGAAITDSQIVGTILYPDRSVEQFSSTTALRAPDKPELATTAKTVAFILEPDDILIEVENRATA